MNSYDQEARIGASSEGAQMPHLDFETAPPDETRQDRMVRLAARLMQFGVSERQILRLLTFDLDRIERQLNWLPYRQARKRASLIVSAIEEDYEAPANWEESNEA